MRSVCLFRRFRIGIRILLLIVSGAATSCAQPDKTTTGTEPAQWRLIWTANPTTEATIAWSTQKASDRNVAHFQSEDREQKGTVASRQNGPYTGSGGKLYYHQSRLHGLTPDTKYFVVMESDGKRSPKFWFRTAPDKDVKVRVLFGGDSRGSGLAAGARREMNRMIAELVEKKPGILALAHGGDFVVSGGVWEQWSSWMTDHELTVTEDGRLLPIIPARGNHDGGKLFNEVFALPVDDTNYYAIDLSPQVRWITLNSNISTGGDQRRWLERELAKSRPTHRWVVTQYHHPIYPAIKLPRRERENWLPLFEKYNIDLSCEADGHNIKRTVPIRHGMEDPTGIVYIGEGGLGVPPRQPKKDRWFLKAPGMAASGHHVHLITFARTYLESRVILLGGEVLERYRRSPREDELFGVEM